MAEQGSGNSIAERDDRTALALCILDATDDLILYVRGMRRRGLDADEYEWLMGRIAEIRRDALRLEAMIDGEGGR